MRRDIVLFLLVAGLVCWGPLARAADKDGKKPTATKARKKAAARSSKATSLDAYGKLAKESVKVNNLKSILLPFVATCSDKKTHFSKLFCTALNERLKAQHQTKTYVATMEASEAGPLVATFAARPKPHVSLTFRGCLTCDGPMLDREGGDVSKGRFFMVKAPKDIRVKRGKIPYDLVGIDVASLKADLPSKTKAKTFRQDIYPFLRIDVHFRPVAGVSKVGRRFKYGVLNFQLAGYRIYDRCSGEVYASSPKMEGKFPVDKTDMTCPQNRPKEDKGPKLPATLPQTKVKALMELVAHDIKSCYERFGKSGDVPTDVVVNKSGKIKSVKVVGKLAGTPTAACIERLVKNVTFPEFRGQDAKLQWPFSLK